MGQIFIYSRIILYLTVSMPFLNPELDEALNADAQIKAYDHLFHVTLTNMSSLTFGTVILQVR